MMRQGYEKPVNEGDVIEVTIEGTGAKGDGIARIDGFVIVVPGGKEGDRVKVKITRVLRKMAFAELAGEGAEEEPAAEEEAPAEEPTAEEEAPTEEPAAEEEAPAEESAEENSEEASEE